MGQPVLAGAIAEPCLADNAGADRPTLPRASTLRSLAATPASVVIVALALNAVFLPYRDRHHDALLYAFQVLNRVEKDRFAEDLFLRYGSQDSYSLFSRSVAPLAQAVGIPAAFLLLYLLNGALSFLAVYRLLYRLLADRSLTALAVIIVAVARPAVGGHGTFHVNENFFTPRLPACTLVLFALERMLAGRLVAAVLFLAAAAALHPLMAVGGVLLFLTSCSVRFLPARTLTWGTAASSVLLLIVYLVPQLGTRVFGYMDEVWLREVAKWTPFMLTWGWDAQDWPQLVTAATAALLGWHSLPRDPGRRQFMIGLCVVTVLAVGGTVLASHRPYALLIQGQPFRALWLLGVLYLPLALAAAAKWWRRGDQWACTAAVALLGYVGLAPLELGELPFLASLCLFFAVAWRGLGQVSRDPGWPWHSLAACFGLLGIHRFAVHCGVIASHWEGLTRVIGRDDAVHVAMEWMDLPLRVVLGLAGVWALMRLVGFGRRFHLAALCIWLGIQTAAFLISSVGSLRGTVKLYQEDVRFVKAFLDSRRDLHPDPPTVYWPIDQADRVWFDLRAKSYLAYQQLSGVAFHRETAIEGRRRADMAGPFLQQAVQTRLAHLPLLDPNAAAGHLAAPEMSAPNLEDLLRLCSDPRLDYVVVPDRFPGWYAANNAAWFVYDCREVRSRSAETWSAGRLPPPRCGTNTFEGDHPRLQECGMRVAVIGAGPAGMAAAYQLAKGGVEVEVYEASDTVGGMSRSFPLWGQTVDLGPHRFFSTDARVNRLWLEVVGEDYRMVDRLTRIYYKNRFFYYPLQPLNALRNMGLWEAGRCVASYLRERAFPFSPADAPETFESWVVGRFGRRLFEMFFKSYSEKLWGLSCQDLDADFAAQRIKKLSLGEAIKAALGLSAQTRHKTLVDQFAYPIGGTGMVYRRMAARVQEWAGQVQLKRPVRRVLHEDQHVYGLEFADAEQRFFDHVVSTMPLTLLVKGLGEIPTNVARAVERLKFRNTILVYLHVDGTDHFPDQWLYIHSPELTTGRVTNFRNWVPELYGKSHTTILALEYWCYDDDALWAEPEAGLIARGIREIRSTSLIGKAAVLHGKVVRVRRCYPVYRSGYKKHLEEVVPYLQQFTGLTPIGRYGSFKYNNQDHSLLMGMMAAENLLEGAGHNLWSVNTDYESYQESARITRTGLVPAAASG